MKYMYKIVMLSALTTVLFCSQAMPMMKLSSRLARVHLTTPKRVSRTSLTKRMASLSLLPQNTVKKLLDTHIDEVLAAMVHCIQLRAIRADRSAAEFSWLPGYMVKLDPSRVQGADELKQVIDKQDLDLLDVADQWAYEIPTDKITDLLSVLCIGKKMEGEMWKPLTLEQAIQLRVLCKYAPFCDPKAPNLIHYKKRIGLCDTQPGVRLCEYQALFKLLYENKLEDDAREYLEHEMRILKQH